jgi:hypothetical protein
MVSSDSSMPSRLGDGAGSGLAMRPNSRKHGRRLLFLCGNQEPLQGSVIMKAVRIHEFGSTAEVLQYEEVPIPDPCHERQTDRSRIRARSCISNQIEGYCRFLVGKNPFWGDLGRRHTFPSKGKRGRPGEVARACCNGIGNEPKRGPWPLALPRRSAQGRTGRCS